MIMKYVLTLHLWMKRGMQVLDVQRIDLVVQKEEESIKNENTTVV